MKYLNQFLKFDFLAFAEGKRFRVIRKDIWKDFDTKEVLGIKIETLIAVDNTPYKRRDDEDADSSNECEKLTFKVAKTDVAVKKGDYIMPVDATATIWGQFRNNLSVKCVDVTVLQAKN